MTSRERVTEFIKKYPNMFIEDINFWIDTIDQLLDEHAKEVLKDFVPIKPKIDAVKRYEELRQTMNLTDAIIQLQDEIISGLR